MQTPFRYQDPRTPFLFGRFHRHDMAGARNAAGNVLSQRHPSEIGQNEILEICRRFHLDDIEIVKLRTELFEHAYRQFALDDRFDDEEAHYLDRLRFLLDIGEDSVIRIERETIYPRYESAIQTVIADGVLTAEEQAGLKRLAAGLRIPQHRANQIYATIVGQVLNREITARLADGKLSPDEFLSFVALAKNLGIDPTFDDNLSAEMHRAAAMWRLGNGELPTVEPPMPLLTGEVCRFVAYGVDWREQRSQVGLQTVDTGRFVVTSKRVIFSGALRSFTIKLESLVGATIYTDAVSLHKATGKHPFIMLSRSDASFVGLLIAIQIRLVAQGLMG